ncbi:MAG TPA: hypothetical protein VJ123_05290 [Anaerolineales bacterium]|nr:hypothetical protein [Anaerolineales bacterium]
MVDPGHSPEVGDQAYQRAVAAKRAHEAELLRKANVVGIGIGLRSRRGLQTGEVALIVLVRRKIPPSQLAIEDRIPAQLEGVPVDIQEVGDVTAHDSEHDAMASS